MTRDETARPLRGSRSQQHRGTGTPHAFHFPVIDPDGNTVYIVEKRLSTPQGVELLIDEDGNEWISAGAGRVVPACPPV